MNIKQSGRCTFLTGLLIILFLSSSFAQETNQNEQKETNRAEKEKSSKQQKTSDGDGLPVRVAEVKGVCEVWRPSDQQKKQPENPDWEEATEGMVLPPGSGVSTGMNAKLFLDLADEGTVIVQSLTQGQIGKLTREQKALTGEFKVNTGNVRVHIEEQEVDANFQVSTPRVTAAVKGSTVQVQSRGDMGDSMYVQEGHMEAKNPSYSETYTGGEKAVQKKGQNSYHRSIESTQMEHLADIAPEGAIEADSPQKMKEMAEKVVDIVTSNSGSDHGGFADSIEGKYGRFAAIHTIFHATIDDAPDSVNKELMHNDLHATNGNPKALEDWFHKHVCDIAKNPQAQHKFWHEKGLGIPESSAGMRQKCERSGTHPK